VSGPTSGTVRGTASGTASGIVRASGKGRRWLATGHPWLYRDDVASAEAEPGGLVRVLDPAGATLGYGLWSERSRIAVRFVTRAEVEPDERFWDERVARALRARERAGLADPAGACRLVAGDADGLPGLVVDRYASVLVVQSGTLAADRLRDAIVERIRRALPHVRAVFERSDAAARRLEGLEERVGELEGELPAEIVVREPDLEYAVDVRAGHKTGHYLDQRENRLRAARHAQGADVLDAFCYDGLFAIRAALAGARSVVALDQSEPALARARQNAERNGVAGRVRFERADCMKALRARAEAGERYGLVVVDPPAFARNRAEAAGAERGYVELNRRAFGLLADEGLLVSASCSHNVKPADFVRHLARAAHAAGVDAWLEGLSGAAPDHPVLLALPESSYLKCAFVRSTARASARTD
jgi:23S rRNA (cytosine1962-C5)-methyltransferase